MTFHVLLLLFFHRIGVFPQRITSFADEIILLAVENLKSFLIHIVSGLAITPHAGERLKHVFATGFKAA